MPGVGRNRSPLLGWQVGATYRWGRIIVHGRSCANTPGTVCLGCCAFLGGNLTVGNPGNAKNQSRELIKSSEPLVSHEDGAESGFCSREDTDCSKPARDFCGRPGANTQDQYYHIRAAYRHLGESLPSRRVGHRLRQRDSTLRFKVA